MLKLKSIAAPAKLSQVAYESIKESILNVDSDDLEDGGRIDEQALTEQLGISRTPVREAVNRLVLEGFLRVIPRHGIYIATKSREENSRSE